VFAGFCALVIVTGVFLVFAEEKVIMKKKVVVFAVLAFCIGCSPVKVSKCVTEYSYEGDKVVDEYTECIEQTPEKRLPIHLKHQELYE
jgi:hypothetical protein